VSGTRPGRDPRQVAIAAAVEWAEVAAMLGDYAEAVGWLGVIDSLGGPLPSELAARRPDWLSRARGDHA
jgi:hypothetical protein